jgi:hypothetical protein
MAQSPTVRHLSPDVKTIDSRSMLRNPKQEEGPGGGRAPAFLRDVRFIRG